MIRRIAMLSGIVVLAASCDSTSPVGPGFTFKAVVAA